MEIFINGEIIMDLLVHEIYYHEENMWHGIQVMRTNDIMEIYLYVQLMTIGHEVSLITHYGDEVVIV
jgi:hypothetical protein